MKIAVIGSSGAMGSFFTHYFSSRGHAVVGSDEARKKGVGFTFVKTNAQAAKDADAVLLAVPIDRTLEVAELVSHSMRRGSLLIEISSVKGKTLRALRRVAERRDLRLLSVHPLFGPGLSKSDRMRVAVMTGKGLSPSEAKTIFPDAKLARMTAEEHDRLMASVLSLTHLVNIAYAKALDSLVERGDFQRAATPTSTLQLSIAKSVLSQDPKLYSYIQFENRFTVRAVDALVEELVSLQTALKGGDRKSLERLMTVLAERFSAAGPKATEEVYRAFRSLGSP
ncbi:MAG: prephenate dehydrogenase/arogenate dehydrogenase family protein [Nitrososphaerales archaeon]|nr:prephenate dehydrogenase/arogenate dehydrogenase family protein [Nitrososphaerales archaeon]